MKSLRTKMKKLLFITVFFTLFALPACNSNSEEIAIEETVDSFSTAYINYDFKSCYNLVTGDSKRWIQFIASNITEDDINNLKNVEETPDYTIKEIKDIDASHSSATIEITNMPSLKQVGDTVKIEDSQTIELLLINKGNRWLVDITHPIRMVVQQQSEKQDHETD